MTGDAPLIIGPDQIALLKSLRMRAEAEPINIAAVRFLERAEAGQHLARMQDFTVILPGPWDFHVTFTLETGHPCGTARHMSVSIARPGRVPHPAAAWIIAQELGYRGGLQDCAMWPEDIGNGDTAINLVQALAH